ncbi:MAG: branched-chain amino acid ABC transporter permease, partial [Pseudomonadota bacterium]|nr:branched-chain amino acid ABC transporter permease [Pseudomonadota bacterium]
MKSRVAAIWRESPARSRGGLAALQVLLALVPLVADRYLLTVMIVALKLAYVGQAWNIMMGFAGQLSLGNALFVGLGAYTAATLFQYFSVSPWLG